MREGAHPAGHGLLLHDLTSRRRGRCVTACLSLRSYPPNATVFQNFIRNSKNTGGPGLQEKDDDGGGQVKDKVETDGPGSAEPDAQCTENSAP